MCRRNAGDGGFDSLLLAPKNEVLMSSSNEKTYRSLELAVDIIQGLASCMPHGAERDKLADIAEDLNDIIVFAQLVRD